MAHSLKVIVDEYKSTHPDHSVKQLLVLQSDELWWKWALAEKEQHRHVYRGNQSLEQYTTEQRQKMELIQKEQFGKAQDLTPLMELFMTFLLRHQGNTRNYFLQWLKLILDDYSRKQLPLLHKQYQQKRNELHKAVNQSEKEILQE